MPNGQEVVAPKSALEGVMRALCLIAEGEELKTVPGSKEYTELREARSRVERHIRRGPSEEGVAATRVPEATGPECSRIQQSDEGVIPMT